MNVIGFITLLQEYPVIGFLIALVFFAFMFGIVLLYSRSVESKKQDSGRESDGH